MTGVLKEYVKFFINGGALGLLAWGGQLSLYHLFGGTSDQMYAVASVIAYIPLVLVNFMIQRAWIFKVSGVLTRFVAANLGVMLLVALTAPVASHGVNTMIGHPWGERVGFAVASLFCSIPSFLIKRHWVFRKESFLTMRLYKNDKI